MIDTEQLIADLEAGPGSRELSNRFLVHACGWTNENVDLLHGTNRGMQSPEGNEFRASWTVDDWQPDLPSPTESIDDALALVPKHWLVTFTQKADGRWQADILRHGPDDSYEQFKSGDADTAALAICITRLRVKETE